jgi:hypothetical protein
LFIKWVKTVQAARNHRGTHAMEELIWRALQTDYSIQADNPGVEDLDVRRLVAQDSEEDTYRLGCCYWFQLIWW